MDYDVIVVGAGIGGASAAYYLVDQFYHNLREGG